MVRIHGWICVLSFFVVYAAAAQTPSDAPAVAVPGSCQRVDFNCALLESPVRIDLAVQVSESGRPLTAVPMARERAQAAAALVRKPRVTDVRECAPTARDYPVALLWALTPRP